jgi:4-amino-4-deoxy-L-arabinose transferase-like glycosyltransferase
MTTRASSFRWLTLAVCAAATVPRLAHRGMFVDGVTYASIARNLAEGRGSFWTPSYTATLYPQFHEHLPLGLWLQSLAFRILGDHLYVERIYSIAIAAATATLMTALWRRLTDDRSEAVAQTAAGGTIGHQPVAAELEWLPIFVWVAMPVVSWAIVGNLLDTTVALFTTASALAALCGVRATKPATAVMWAVVSGLCCVAATLTKGPVGLFPLAAPLAFAILPDARHIARTLFGQLATVAVFAIALTMSSSSRSSVIEYLNVQLLPSMSGRRELAASSFTILKELLQGVALPAAGVAALAIALAHRFVRPSKVERTRGASVIALGLAGSLPILVSAKQSGHYLVPAIPLFAVGTAAWLAPTVATLLQRRAVAPWPQLATVVALVYAVAASFAPILERDRTRMETLDLLDRAMPRAATAGICPAANADWGLHAWLQRRFLVSLDAATGTDRGWFIETAGAARCAPPHCTPITDPSRDIVLMKCSRSE